MEYGYEYFGLKMEQGNGICWELPSRTGTLDQFTVMLWFETSDDNTKKSLIMQEGGLDIGISFDAIYLSYGSQTEETKPVLLKNIWNHLAVVLYDSSMEVFLNGASVLLKDFSNPVLTANPVTIGKDFFGHLRSVTIYKNALITEEIQRMMYQKDETKPALIDCDFTMNPPMELISQKQIDLPDRAQIVRLAPSAVFENFSYFRCAEQRIRPWIDVSKAFSLQVWLCFSPDALQDYHVVFSNLDPLRNSGVELGIVRREGGHKLCVDGGVANTPILESSATLPTETWKNIALVCSQKNLKLYIDGTVDSETTVDSVPGISENAVIRIGARGSASDENGSDWYHGTMARLDLWKTALTQAQVSAYAEAGPQGVENDLLASWDFFETNVIDVVSGVPLGRMDSARVSQQEKASEPNTKEYKGTMRMPFEECPVLPEELIQKEREASGILDCIKTNTYDPKMVLVTSCAYQDRIYFLCHDTQTSYPITSMEADTDEVIIWCMELLLIIISGIVSYFLSLKITYSNALSQYIRDHILSVTAVRTVVATIADSGGITTASLLALLKEIICSGNLSTILRMACSCGFWTIMSFVLGITRRFLSAGTDIVIWVGALAAQVAVHISRFPKGTAFNVQLEEVLFCHNTPNKICSIHIRKNAWEAWQLPEWVNGREETNNAPAVYRLARFSKNGDVLEIKAQLLTVNSAKETKTYELRVVGGNPFGTSATQEIHCPPGTACHTVYFKFEDAKKQFEENGIMQYDLELSWEFRETTKTTDVLDFIRFQLSKHKIYSILDSVNPPWGPERIDIGQDGAMLLEPMTDFYDKTIDLVRSANRPEVALQQIEEKLFGDGKYKYQGNSVMGVNEKICLSSFQNFLSYNGSEPYAVNCQDCSILMISIANLYGCNLKYALQSFEFKLAGPVLLIGETEERLPETESGKIGYFTFHYFSVDGDLALNDPRRWKCYDPCLKYHGRADPGLRLASGVPVSAFQTPGPQPLPQTESYLECIMENSPEGIGKYNIQGHNGSLYFLDLDNSLMAASKRASN